MNFIGTKVALIHNADVLVIQRDHNPGIRWPGLWDLPGGGREGNETPIECGLREIKEELGINIDAVSIVWNVETVAMHDPTLKAFFLGASITQTGIDNVVFGNEGLGWKMMPIADFLDADDVVKPLKPRLRAFWETRTSKKPSI